MGNNVCSTDFSVGSSFNQTPCVPIGPMIDRKINSSEILMVSKSKCPACKSAKQLFSELYQELGVWPTIVELDQYDKQTYKKIVDYLETKTKIRTVPQIFFQGQFVGGNSDVQRLRRQRALIRKYKASQGIDRPANANIIRLSPVFNYTFPKRIKTEPVMLAPTQIKSYMATEYATEYPAASSVQEFALAPSAPVSSSSKTFNPRFSNSLAAPVVEEKEDIPARTAPSMYNSNYQYKQTENVVYPVVEEVVSPAPVMEMVEETPYQQVRYSNQQDELDYVEYTDTEDTDLTEIIDDPFVNPNNPQFEEPLVVEES